MQTSTTPKRRRYRGGARYRTISSAGRTINSNKQLGTAKLLRTAGDDLSPLMCLSVHEHAWMSAGLGVWQGGVFEAVLGV